MIASTMQNQVSRDKINPADLRICNPPKGCLDCLAATALARELTADSHQELSHNYSGLAPENLTTLAHF